LPGPASRHAEVALGTSMERKSDEEVDVTTRLNCLCDSLRKQVIFTLDCISAQNETPDDFEKAECVIEQLLKAISDAKSQSRREKRKEEPACAGELVFETLVEELPVTKCVNGVLNPNWFGRLFWDMCIMSLVMLDSVILPLQLAWPSGEPTAFDKAWLWFTTGSFVMDMFFSFSTAYIPRQKNTELPPGTLETNKKTIASEYLRGWFFLDFVSVVPWGFIIFFGSDGGAAGSLGRSTRMVKFVRFVRLVRMARLAKLATLWERLEDAVGSLYLRQAVLILRPVGLLCMICHWYSCVWWMTGDPDGLIGSMIIGDHWTEVPQTTGPPWLERSGFEQYAFCFYWTLGVMRTMPAEVTPVNLVERTSVLIFMFLAFSVFATCISQITTTYMKIQGQSRDFEDEMAQLKLKLRNSNVDRKTAACIREFMRYQFDRKRGQYRKEDAGIRNLNSPHIHSMINFSLWKPHLMKLQMCRQWTLSDEVLRQLFDKATTEEDFPSNQVICAAHRPALECYILLDGELRFEDLDAEDVIKHSSTHIEIVNENCLETEAPVMSERTILTRTCAQLLKVRKKEFWDAFRTHEVRFRARWVVTRTSNSVLGRENSNNEMTDSRSMVQTA